MAPQTYHCEICLTPFYSPHPPFPPLPIPACGHHHCPRCLVENLTQSLQTIPFKPPTCCTTATYVPPSIFRRLPASIPQEMIQLYRQKLTEYESLLLLLRSRSWSPPRRVSRTTTTPGGPVQAQPLLATYCHNPKCSAFIPDILAGRCRSCKNRTCVSCKAGFHLGEGGCRQQDLDLAEERTEMRRFHVHAVGVGMMMADGEAGAKNEREKEREMWVLTRELMRERGWRRCPVCKAGVEKTEGCNHMSCVCGCEWYYRCEEVWGAGHRIWVGGCAG